MKDSVAWEILRRLGWRTEGVRRSNGEHATGHFTAHRTFHGVKAEARGMQSRIIEIEEAITGKTLAELVEQAMKFETAASFANPVEDVSREIRQAHERLTTLGEVQAALLRLRAEKA